MLILHLPVYPRGKAPLLSLALDNPRSYSAQTKKFNERWGVNQTTAGLRRLFNYPTLEGIFSNTFNYQLHNFLDSYMEKNFDLHINS